MDGNKTFQCEQIAKQDSISSLYSFNSEGSLKSQ